jgi:hypothetical protein
VQVGMCTRGRCDQQGCKAEAACFFFYQTKTRGGKKKRDRIPFFFFYGVRRKDDTEKNSKVFEFVRILFEKGFFFFEKKHRRAVPRQRHGVGFFCFSQFHREQITIDSSRVSGNISRGDQGIAGMEANGKKK